MTLIADFEWWTFLSTQFPSHLTITILLLGWSLMLVSLKLKILPARTFFNDFAGLDKLHAQCWSGMLRRAWAHKTSETCLIFKARTFCLVEKKTLELQVFSWINKTVKKLPSIKSYISDGIKIVLSTHGLRTT